MPKAAATKKVAGKTPKAMPITPSTTASGPKVFLGPATAPDESLTLSSRGDDRSRVTAWPPPILRQVPIRINNVAIAVENLDDAVAFFEDLGLEVLGRDVVSGEWTDTAVGLDGNHAKIAMLQTPDGAGRLELFEYINPPAIQSRPTRPNDIGMHRVAFEVDDIDEALAVAARHGYHPLRGVATYEHLYRLTYLRGPSGILLMLAQPLKTE